MAPVKSKLRSNLQPEDDTESLAAVAALEEQLAAPDKPTPIPVRTAAVVKIVLEDNEFIPPTGLFVGVNGKSYLIRSGVPVMVNPGILDVLDHAIMSVAVRDPQTLQVIGHRERQRYPYKRIA